jgi:hypothetical protein
LLKFRAGQSRLITINLSQGEGLIGKDDLNFFFRLGSHDGEKMMAICFLKTKRSANSLDIFGSKNTVASAIILR